MQINTAEMPKTLDDNSIYWGLDHLVDSIRDADKLERSRMLKQRRNRVAIKNLAENYFSHFSGRMFGEAFQNNLIKMEDDSTELLFSIFSYMLTPLAGAMIHGDMRNQGTRDFIAKYSALDLSTVELKSMYCKFEPESDKHNAEFKDLTGTFISELTAVMQKFDMAHAQVAVCFAAAFKTVHPTIQQNFMRAFCQTAAVLGRNHLENGIEIKSEQLLQVVSAVSCTEAHCFPYI